jgi:hypothetical protein
MRWSIVGIVVAVAIAMIERHLGPDVTLRRPYIDRIDRIALCAAAETFALARDQAYTRTLPARPRAFAHDKTSSLRVTSAI